MTITIRIEPARDGKFDVDFVIKALKQKYPGTKITAPDSFQAARQKALKAIKNWSQAGEPVDRPDAILASIKNREVALGPGKDIEIPFDEAHLLRGHVWSKDIVLRSELVPPPAAVDSMLAFFNALQIGFAQIYEDD